MTRVSDMANSTAPPEHSSLLPSPLPCRDGDGVLWGYSSCIGAVLVALVLHGIAQCREAHSHAHWVSAPKVLNLASAGLAAAYLQCLRLSAACLMALLSGKMKYMVGQ